MSYNLESHKLPDQLPVKGHDAQFTVPSDGKVYGPSITNYDLPITYQAGKLQPFSDAMKHPGFAAVQSKIAAKEGVSKDRAGAILAAASRGASAKAKHANPHLKRVKG